VSQTTAHSLCATFCSQIAAAFEDAIRDIERACTHEDALVAIDALESLRELSPELVDFFVKKFQKHDGASNFLLVVKKQTRYRPMACLWLLSRMYF
jgi:hypothetical protein